MNDIVSSRKHSRIVNVYLIPDFLIDFFFQMVTELCIFLDFQITTKKGTPV